MGDAAQIAFDLVQVVPKNRKQSGTFSEDSSVQHGPERM